MGVSRPVQSLGPAVWCAIHTCKRRKAAICTMASLRPAHTPFGVVQKRPSSESGLGATCTARQVTPHSVSMRMVCRVTCGPFLPALLPPILWIAACGGGAARGQGMQADAGTHSQGSELPAALRLPPSDHSLCAFTHNTAFSLEALSPQPYRGNLWKDLHVVNYIPPPDTTDRAHKHMFESF